MTPVNVLKSQFKTLKYLWIQFSALEEKKRDRDRRGRERKKRKARRKRERKKRNRH